MSDRNVRMFHLSLNVTDLERSVEFYRRALGAEPAKHYPDYAKFEIGDPPLVLSLEPGRAPQQPKLNHLGVRLTSPQALQDFAMRLSSAGLDPQYLQGVECCYSRQTKICLNDPDENLIEFYLVEQDLEKSANVEDAKAKEQGAGSSPGPAVAWEHLLGSPFPLPIPLENQTVDEVRLRGTFNIRRDETIQTAILKEAARVLRPGGQVMLHLLVSNKEVARKLPRLPGPAALVEHTPVESEIQHRLERAGFVAITCKRLSHSAVFQFDGAEMRELMVTALRPPAEEETASRTVTVVYKGPFVEIKDDTGQVYRRGARTVVGGKAFSLLKHSLFADQFVFLNEATPPSACSTAAGREAEATI